MLNKKVFVKPLTSKCPIPPFVNANSISSILVVFPFLKSMKLLINNPGAFMGRHLFPATGDSNKREHLPCSCSSRTRTRDLFALKSSANIFYFCERDTISKLYFCIYTYVYLYIWCCLVVLTAGKWKQRWTSCFKASKHTTHVLYLLSLHFTPGPRTTSLHSLSASKNKPITIIYQ